MKRASAKVKRYWDRIVQMGCIVTGATHNVTIHHPHGGSMKTRGVHRACGRKGSHWLAIPLVDKLHVGPNGIDGPDRIPVKAWEAMHGNQADMIDELVKRTGIDVWELARAEEKGMVRRRR